MRVTWQTRAVRTGLVYDPEQQGGTGLQVRLLMYLVSLSAHRSPQI